MGSDKVRFQMYWHETGWKGIRAIQGHNAELDIDNKLMQRKKISWEQMPYVYHGTRRALISRIAKEGIIAGGGDLASYGG